MLNEAKRLKLGAGGAAMTLRGAPPSVDVKRTGNLPTRLLVRSQEIIVCRHIFNTTDFIQENSNG